MIGVIVVSHGNLAAELCAATLHVVGEQENFISVAVQAEDDRDVKEQEIRRAVKACDSGQGVVIFTDIYGGTPSNLAIQLVRRGKVDVIAGVNLPALIKMMEVRGKETLENAVQIACADGKRFIRIVSQELVK